jgi:hypothetical protein
MKRSPTFVGNQDLRHQFYHLVYTHYHINMQLAVVLFATTALLTTAFALTAGGNKPMCGSAAA